MVSVGPIYCYNETSIDVHSYCNKPEAAVENKEYSNTYALHSKFLNYIKYYSVAIFFRFYFKFQFSHSSTIPDM